MTFVIVLFIVLMQFLWKHIDDLVGKGLPISLIAELFFYAGVSMVPMALPLAILLASLMTFGNFGEKFELTAMKASGISLFRAMRPLIVLITLISIGAFFFQNNVLPQAQVKMWTLLFSMRQKSPELEIPEGVFYDQIPGYNLFVGEKNRETGELFDLMIYDVTRGGDNATILVADSGRLAFTNDMKYLYLHLHYGEQFENLREQKSMEKDVPFRRETFHEKEILIPFDANFNRLDEGGLKSQYIGKNIDELNHTIDSVNSRLDSTGMIYARELRASTFPLVYDRNGEFLKNDKKEESIPGQPFNNRVENNLQKDQSKEESSKTEMFEDKDLPPLNLDSLLLELPSDLRARVFDNALSKSRREVNDYQFKSLTVAEDKKNLRRHQIELIKKYTLSVACLIFFFIGAPLGAIIRKGGLGTPLVISVLLFLFYYIIDNAGYKLARDGHWVVWAGIWLSTFVLAPLGVYVTYKAMNDSAVFDADRYKALWRKIRRVRMQRSIGLKEVIINDVDPDIALLKLNDLIGKCEVLLEILASHKGFGNYWKNRKIKTVTEKIEEETENVITYLSDSRSIEVLSALSEYPFISCGWKCQPLLPAGIHKYLKFIYPVSVPLYFIGLKNLKKLKKETEKTIFISEKLINLIKNSET